MNSERMKELFAEVIKVAQKQFLVAQEYERILPPQLAMVGMRKNGESYFEVEYFSDFGDDRGEQLISLGAKVGAQGVMVEAIFLLSEVWMLEVPLEKGRHMTHEQARMLAETMPQPASPNRIEALVVGGMAIGTSMNTMLAVMKIERSEAVVDGSAMKSATLSEPIISSDGSSQFDLMDHFWAGYVPAFLA